MVAIASTRFRWLCSGPLVLGLRASLTVPHKNTEESETYMSRCALLAFLSFLRVRRLARSFRFAHAYVRLGWRVVHAPITRPLSLPLVCLVHLAREG